MIRFKVSSSAAKMQVSDNSATMHVDNAVLVAGGGGSGNVFSNDVAEIKVMDLEEFNSLTLKDSATLYFIRG